MIIKNLKYIVIFLVGNHSQGRPKGSLFIRYYTEV